MILSARKEYVALPTLNGHASNLCRFRGKTYLTWFGGTKEGADDVNIYVTCRDEAGWRAPVCVCADAALPHWNPVMLAQDDHIDLFFKLGRPIARWHTMRARLDGELNIIEAPRELVPGDIGGRGPVKNKCLRLKSGRLLAPASLEEGTWRPFVDISDDNGETFRLVPVPLYRLGDRLPAVMDRPYGFAQKAGAIQPTLWQTDDGAVHMLMRSSEGRVLRSDSTDEGETWCPAWVTDLPNNNSGLDLVRMDSGLIVLALNPVSGDWAARSPLSLLYSTDNGDRFQPLMTLETRPGEFSYPSVIAEGRRLYVSYTWDRVRMAVWTIDFE